MNATETKIRKAFLAHLEAGLLVTEAITATANEARDAAKRAGWGEDLVQSTRSQTARYLIDLCIEAAANNVPPADLK